MNASSVFQIMNGCTAQMSVCTATRSCSITMAERSNRRTEPVPCAAMLTECSQLDATELVGL
jgi:hypothetical protein